MADEVKKEGGGVPDWILPSTAGGLFLWLIVIFVIMFLIWLISGGVSRSQNEAAYVVSPVANLSPNETGSSSPTETQAPNGWQTKSFSDFTVNIPPGWYGDITRSESLISRGTFTNGTTTLAFEYGLYTNADIDPRDTRYTITTEKIGGQTMEIFTPKFIGNKTEFFFDRYPQNESLLISGIALSPVDQATALAIAKSVRFSD